MKTYKPYQMIKKCSLGKVEDVRNQHTGVTKPVFSTVRDVHYAQVKRSLTQKYLISLGSSLNDTIMIAIQHQDMTDIKLVKMNGVVYDIEDNSIDDSNVYIKYDILTLQENTKVGGSNG
ncbi:phage head closure protein [Liquorilactobacillus uvarum]|uniref:phage head closure protein n=1 Tax=Liquorilactobacillus uvarum TaxID=303240 RepID=UPI00288AC5D0|nr:phage head closure protein [Liquorilactobacillus uvarum]